MFVFNLPCNNRASSWSSFQSQHVHNGSGKDVALTCLRLVRPWKLYHNCCGSSVNRKGIASVLHQYFICLYYFLVPTKYMRHGKAGQQNAQILTKGRRKTMKENLRISLFWHFFLFLYSFIYLSLIFFNSVTFFQHRCSRVPAMTDSSSSNPWNDYLFTLRYTLIISENESLNITRIRSGRDVTSGKNLQFGNAFSSGVMSTWVLRACDDIWNELRHSTCVENGDNGADKGLSFVLLWTLRLRGVDHALIEHLPIHHGKIFLSTLKKAP